MATIVLCTLPLTSSINATLKLAKSLEKRGHRVVFCGMADGEAAVASHGFAFIPVFEDWFPKGFVDQWVTSKVERRSWRDQIHCLLAERKKLLQHERYINFLIQGGYKEFQTAIRS
ncbi:MAG: hypothetical protein OEU26_25200, partial [Candidatus Tectomicrobia bacterium]|nr:hypothetical protein [Candidatus Tectomicrobia bacterium]